MKPHRSTGHFQKEAGEVFLGWAFEVAPLQIRDHSPLLKKSLLNLRLISLELVWDHSSYFLLPENSPLCLRPWQNQNSDWSSRPTDAINVFCLFQIAPSQGRAPQLFLSLPVRGILLVGTVLACDQKREVLEYSPDCSVYGYVWLPKQNDRVLLQLD